ncbi:MAG: sulfur carrier protein ThiS [Candidatus Dormibacteraceae bacterium]
MIHLQINGKSMTLAEETALSTYLGDLGVDPRAVAVEVNGRILERSDIANTVLRDGDIVEVVKMVGGGT